MITALRHRSERLIACAALGALLASAGGVAWAALRRAPSRRTVAFAVSNPPAYVPLRPPAISDGGQMRPTSVSAGPDLLSAFDLFTASRLSFDRVAGRYRVFSAHAVAAPAADFPYQLVGLAREPYPVQLAGYFGDSAAYTVSFTVAGSSQLKFCQVGDLVAERLRLTRFALIGKEALAGRDAVSEGGYPEAELSDEASGQRIVLDGRAPTLTERMRGTLCRPGIETKDFLIRLGDEIEAGGTSYRIETMDDVRGEVTLVMIAPASLPRTRHTLRLQPRDPLQSAAARPALPPSSAGSSGAAAGP